MVLSCICRGCVVVGSNRNVGEMIEMNDEHRPISHDKPALLASKSVEEGAYVLLYSRVQDGDVVCSSSPFST